MIDSMMELLDAPEGTRPMHLSDVDADAQQKNEDDEKELEETNPLDTSDLPTEDGKSDKPKPPDPDGCPFRPIQIATRDELIDKARSLAYNQRIVFDKVISYAKSVVKAEKGKDPMPRNS